MIINKLLFMKKQILDYCFYINVLMIVIFIALMFAVVFGSELIFDIFKNETFINIRMILSIPILILWIYNLIIWSREDKNIGRFLLLFFLNGLYNPFYYKSIIRKGWLK